MLTVCVFLGYTVFSLAYDNLAINKPAYQQYPYQGQLTQEQTGASNAVDGLKSDLDAFNGQCVISADGQQTATWWVNLTSILSIHHIRIYYRTGNVAWGSSNDFGKRFLGFSLFVSNTTNKTDGMLCFKDTNFTPSTIPAVLNITCLVHGQYVIYYNERLAGVTYPDGYSTFAFNELCEVEVYGHECPDGMFGDGCRGTCGFCSDPTQCHHVNGTCLGGCKPGYKGEYCNLICGNGTYGLDCKKTCGHCRDKHDCHHINGTCLTGCTPGYVAGFCNSPCRKGTYGEGCNYKCGRCKNQSDCYHVNGTCLTGCEPGYYGNQCKTYNLAFNKPTNQQYRYNGLSKALTQSGNAVDGLKSNLSVWGGQCVISANNKQSAVWWVNLTSIHHIYFITIFYRTENLPWGPSNGNAPRFLGFSLYISNTTDKANGTLCFKGTNFTTTTIPAIFIATCPFLGQYVIYYNERLPGVTYPDGYSQHAFNDLCEVEVFGSPEQGSYGSNCSIPCPYPHCRHCCIETGICHECEPGFQGHHCELECPDGMFGDGCQATCGHCSDPKQCHHVNGACLDGCKPGYKGAYCNLTCDLGTFGMKCNETCGYCLNQRHCFHINGTCVQGCVPGYIEDLCKTPCNHGRYGHECKDTCGHCQNKSNCYHTNGSCLNGCDPGYQGKVCKIPCENATYGHECKNKCGNCFGHSNCYHVNGTCLNGCDPGFKEDICRTLCDIGTYGPKCENVCGHCIDPGDCFHVNGTCTNGCDAGYIGNLCKTPCDSGYYGENCNSICGHCSSNDFCHHINGSCLHGCNPGYNGQFCTDACENGTYGKECNETCGHCQNEEHCYYTNGTCLTGCIPGYQGELCKIQCSTGLYGENCSSICGNCSNGDPCHHINGSCLHGCDTGYQGLFCTEAIKASVRGKEPMSSSIGAVIGVFIALILIIVVVFIVRRKRHQKHSREKDDTSQEKRMTISFHNQFYNNVTIGQQTDDAGPSQGVSVSIPSEDENRESSNWLPKEQEDVYVNVVLPQGIPVNKLESVIAEKRANGNKGFKEEYATLPSGEKRKCDVGKKLENTSKNRYKTTFPYDHSRVTLNVTEKEQSDYINANYIDGTNRPKEYIAAQGPKANTLGDFWRMVWQEDVQTIVMVTNLKEGDRIKCTQYWPNLNKARLFGSLSIKLTDEKEYAFFIERKLSIINTALKQTRVVTQYHYITWPDHGTPEPINLLDFHHHVMNSTNGSTVPTVVHCSAGVGRTGTFIALDALYQEGKKTGKVNVSEFVKRMRSNRVSMVQTNEQYITIFLALNEVFKAPINTCSPIDFCTRTENTMKDNPANQNPLRKEFQHLLQVTPVYTEADYKMAIQAYEGRQTDKVLPVDKYSVHLCSSVPKRGSYINAIFAPSFTRAERFIVTQNPTQEDAVDFLRMLKDNESDTVICLDPMNDVESSWLPNSNSTKVVVPFTIHCQSTSSNDVIEHVIHILQEKHQDDPYSVFVVEPRKIINPLDNPMDTTDILRLVSYVFHSKTEKPITVLSSDGASLCGVFIAVHNAVQQLEMDGDVDVFTTVRQLQVRRPELCGNIDEYAMISKALYDHIQTTEESIYCNQ